MLTSKTLSFSQSPIIYAKGELVEKATAEDFSVVQNKGGRASGACSSTTVSTLAEYAEFNRTQKIESDFDRMLKATKALGVADVKPGSKPPRKKK